MTWYGECLGISYDNVYLCLRGVIEYEKYLASEPSFLCTGIFFDLLLFLFSYLFSF